MLSSLHKCHTGMFTLVCATVLAALPASSYASAMEKPNILFLMGDDWSAPHAGILGDPVVKTPAFDRIAREGVLFRNAFVSSPSCTPSRLAIATGQWHWRLEDGKNLGGALREGVPVYPEMLQAAGYQIGFAHKGAAPSDYRYTDRDPFGPRFKTFEEFLAQRKAGTPFCFWHGPSDTHRPYRYGNPDQLHNVAGDARYAAMLDQMGKRLLTELRASGDPLLASQANSAQTPRAPTAGQHWQPASQRTVHRGR